MPVTMLKRHNKEIQAFLHGMASIVLVVALLASGAESRSTPTPAPTTTTTPFTTLVPTVTGSVSGSGMTDGSVFAECWLTLVSLADVQAALAAGVDFSSTEAVLRWSFELVCSNYRDYFACLGAALNGSRTLTSFDRLMNAIMDLEGAEAAYDSMCANISEIVSHADCLVSTETNVQITSCAEAFVRNFTLTSTDQEYVCRNFATYSSCLKKPLSSTCDGDFPDFLFNASMQSIKPECRGQIESDGRANTTTTTTTTSTTTTMTTTTLPFTTLAPTESGPVSEPGFLNGSLFVECYTQAFASDTMSAIDLGSQEDLLRWSIELQCRNYEKYYTCLRAGLDGSRALTRFDELLSDLIDLDGAKAAYATICANVDRLVSNGNCLMRLGIHADMAACVEAFVRNFTMTASGHDDVCRSFVTESTCVQKPVNAACDDDFLDFLFTNGLQGIEPECGGVSVEVGGGPELNGVAKCTPLLLKGQDTIERTEGEDFVRPYLTIICSNYEEFFGCVKAEAPKATSKLDVAMFSIMDLDGAQEMYSDICDNIDYLLEHFHCLENGLMFVFGCSSDEIGDGQDFDPSEFCRSNTVHECLSSRNGTGDCDPGFVQWFTAISLKSLKPECRGATPSSKDTVEICNGPHVFMGQGASSNSSSKADLVKQCVSENSEAAVCLMVNAPVSTNAKIVIEREVFHFDGYSGLVQGACETLEGFPRCVREVLLTASEHCMMGSTQPGALLAKAKDTTCRNWGRYMSCVESAVSRKCNPASARQWTAISLSTAQPWCQKIITSEIFTSAASSVFSAGVSHVFLAMAAVLISSYF